MMRGRGRGRGPPSGARPQARDDKGNIVEATQEGPPPVYPEKDVPPVQNTANATAMLPQLKSLRQVNSSYLASAFNLGREENRKRRSASNVALASVVTLNPSYYPRELYSEQQRSRGGSTEAQAAYWSSHSRQLRHKEDTTDDFTLGRIDVLVQKENLGGGGGGPGGDDAAAGGGGGGEGGEVLVEEEDEGYDDEDMLGEDEDQYANYDDDDLGVDDDDDDGQEACF